MKRFLSAVLVTLASASTAASEPVKAAPASDPRQLARGKYLVTVGGCNDCHTPWKMGPNGPEQDMSRMLSGHPEQLVMPPAPKGEGPWGVGASLTNTAWAGPWGVSFTRNLTPDKETGLGNWTEKDFVQTLRSGKRMGHGRALLPPMPWFNYGEMTDEDLKAVWAYLQSIPAVRNRVEEPRPPAAAPQAAAPAAK